jgi:hypothetical protein
MTEEQQKKQYISTIMDDVYDNPIDWQDTLHYTFVDYLNSLSVYKIKDEYGDWLGIEDEEEEKEELIEALASEQQGFNFVQDLAIQYLNTLSLEEIKKRFKHHITT